MPAQMAAGYEVMWKTLDCLEYGLVVVEAARVLSASSSTGSLAMRTWREAVEGVDAVRRPTPGLLRP